jgi:hypothetical protein
MNFPSAIADQLLELAALSSSILDISLCDCCGIAFEIAAKSQRDIFAIAVKSLCDRCIITLRSLRNPFTIAALSLFDRFAIALQSLCNC